MQDYTGRDAVIFEQARLLPATERSAYLNQACGDNAELRRRVEGMLAAHVESNSGEPGLSATPPTDNEWPTGMPRPAIVGQRVGPYKLLQEIGEGGGGKVFLAEQEQPVRRRVALKIIKLGMDTEEVIARFEAERQALAMMDHPNIARVLDAGATPTGRPYFVMELVKGVPITQFCNEQKLSIAERLKLFILVCNAVQHAHQKGIIHRDIKPSNILVESHDGVPTPKVIDFGIAKATGGRLTDKTFFTAMEQFVGTPAYMSPEQAAVSNVDVDTRSDIYGLGVLLYELLTGCTPLDQEKLKEAGVDEIRRCIREEEPPRPSARVAALDGEKLAAVAKQRHTDAARLAAILRGDLDWIVMRCLEKDRQRRYETASALAQDLQHYLANEPVSARPPSQIYLLQKMARRHRTMFVSVTAITAALVLGLGAAIWSAHQERVQRTRADAQAALAQSAEKAAKTAEADTAGALSRVDYLMAVNLAQDDKLPEAVAHLVRALRDWPDNHPAATLLCSILTMRNWLVPADIKETTVPVAPRGGPRGARGFNQNFRGPGTRGATGLITKTSQDGSRTLRGGRGPLEILDKDGKQLLDKDGKPLFPPITNARADDLSADGRWVAVALQDHTVRLLDAASGQPVSPPMRHEGDLTSVELSADGRQVITKSVVNDPGARSRRDVQETWNYVGNPALQMVLPAAKGTTILNESPDGKLLLTVSSDDSVQVWNAMTGKTVGEPMKSDQPVRTAIFSPDCKRVATVSPNNTLRIWDAATGQAVTPPIPDNSRAGDPGGRAGLGQGRGGPGTRVSFSPDSRKILLLANDRTAQVLDAATGQAAMPALHQDAGFSSAAFSPDGKKILTVSNAVQIWDAANGGQILEFAKDLDSLDFAAFSPDGKQVLTTSLAEAQVWDAGTGQAVGDPIRQSDQNVSASFSPDGGRILTFTRAADGAARVWNADTGQPVSALMQGGGILASAAFSPDGRWVITSSQNVPAQNVRGQNGAAQNTRIWDAGTGLAVSVPLACRLAKFSPDGRSLLTVDDEGAVQIWPFCDNIGPAWMLDLAETLAQCRLDSTGSLGFYQGKTFDELRRDALQEKDGNQPMVQWAKQLLGVAPTVEAAAKLN